ncbi:MAG: Holliday junction branch migration protein RuvA [Desulfobulbaceae bacterium]|nr:Holliday junction branch migration protein RuvA [Desulfobulbaceae bacterium]MCK5341024.1 Holliday junction branch migration protein RuvA [Desulfobulbaceae bacterium]MCK5404394.1 Holliday junction branch migration protein RuvA [Desulfobulbaceae bacterium]
MIACLRGELFYKSAEKLIVDVMGVGYQVFLSSACHARLPDLGHEIFLHIYTDVREDALNLYGFADMEEKEMFLVLISVSGVGPKLSLSILSGITPSELARAITSDDIVRLTKLSGVGKKTAERLCLELKDKVHFVPDQQPGGPVRIQLDADDTLSADVLSALVNLGYTRVSANKALDAVRREVSDDVYATMHLEDLIRHSLRVLA